MPSVPTPGEAVTARQVDAVALLVATDIYLEAEAKQMARELDIHPKDLRAIDAITYGLAWKRVAKNPPKEPHAAD